MFKAPLSFLRTACILLGLSAGVSQAQIIRLDSGTGTIQIIDSPTGQGDIIIRSNSGSIGQGGTIRLFIPNGDNVLFNNGSIRLNPVNIISPINNDIPKDILTESRFPKIGKVLRLMLSQRCRKNSPSKFVDTGRGGYTPSPAEIGSLALSSWEDLRILPSSNRQVSLPINATYSLAESLVEAQGWSQRSNGQITLVADAQVTLVANASTNVTASGFTQPAIICRS